MKNGGALIGFAKTLFFIGDGMIRSAAVNFS
jgi:hypothetical protein